MAELMEEAIEISDKLIPCNICGRTFLPTPLKKHYKVCEKNATRKRKTFDSLKQRIEGTDIAQFHKPTSIKKSENHHINVPPPIASVVTTNEEKINKNQSKWKEKHEALVQAIRAAKGGKEMSPRRSISAVGTMGTTEQCPSCDRHFGPKAYDRHVEWCKEHKGRTAKSPANVLIAKERLEARTKYRVPPLNKSKRSLTREKYATSSNRSESLTNVRSTSSLDKINLERNTGARKSKQSSVSVVPPNFQSVGEPIIKTKSPSTEKIKSKEDYDPFVIAEKQLMELLQCDDFKPCKSTNKTPSPIPKSIPDKAFNKRSSSANYQDKIDILQDNFEIIENYINDNYVNIDESKNSKFSHKKNTGNSNLNKTDKNETLSLNSILSKRKYSDDINAIDPILINETDNLAIPDKLFVDSYSPEFCNDVDHYSVQYDRNISVLEPLVLPKTEVNMKRSISVQNNQPLDDVIFEELISSFNDDETFPTLKSFLQTSKSETNKSGKKIPQKSTHSLNSSYGKNSTMKNVDVKKHPLSPLKRSVSLTNPIVKARSMKNKQDIQDYLHVRDNKPSRMENEKLRDVSPNPSEELFPVDHDMYEEYKRYEEMYKKEKYDSSFDQPKTSEDFEKDDASSSEDNTHADRKHQIIKVSSDSAYGSLNRKSPKVQTRLSNRHGQMYQSKQTNVGRSPSSSGSEVSVITKPKTTQRLTKFCHECGTKYPLDCAKFCVECGIKRLVL